VDGWRLLTVAADPTVIRIGSVPAAPLRPGEVRLAVERFALAMDGATHTRFGLPFLDAFPAPAGHRGLPVWARLRVTESRGKGIAAGERYHGFVPAGSEHVLAAEPAGSGVLDTTPERATLPAWYRTFLPAGTDGHDDPRTVFGPVFATSFALAALLGRQAELGAKSVLIGGAAGPVAVGLADLLAGDTDLLTVGLTSPDTVEFVRGAAGCDDAAGYDDLANAPLLAPAVFVDLTGDHRLVAEVHRRFHDDLAHTVLAGYTHPASVPPRSRDRYREAENRFLRAAGGWLTAHHHSGPDAVAEGVAALLTGPDAPDEAHVFLP